MRTIYTFFGLLLGAGAFLLTADPATARPPMARVGMANPAMMGAAPRMTPMVVPRVRMSSPISFVPGPDNGKIKGPVHLTRINSPDTNPLLPPGAVTMQGVVGTNRTFFSTTNPFFTNTGTLSPTSRFMLLEQSALDFSMNPGASAVTGMNSLLPPGIGSILPPGFTFPTFPITGGISPIITPFGLGSFSTLTNPLLLGSTGFNGFTPVAGFTPGSGFLVNPNLTLLASSGMNAMPIVALGSLSPGGMTSPATLPFVVALNSDTVLSPEQEKELMRKLALVKSQSGASATTVWAATDLNALLDDLKDHPNWAGRDLPLSEAVMRHINIGPAKSYANAGMLKNNRRWPELLQRDEFQAEKNQIETLIPKLVSQAKEGAVKTDDLQVLDETVKTVRERLAGLIQEVPDPAYIRAKRFLSDLQSGIKVLRQPDAAGYFSPVYSPKVNTVQELVRYMTKNDLRFAPATTGDEAAYLVFYRALATYDVSANLQQGSPATNQVASAK